MPFCCYMTVMSITIVGVRVQGDLTYWYCATVLQHLLSRLATKSDWIISPDDWTERTHTADHDLLRAGCATCCRSGCLLLQHLPLHRM